MADAEELVGGFVHRRVYRFIRVDCLRSCDAEGAPPSRGSGRKVRITLTEERRVVEQVFLTEDGAHPHLAPAYGLLRDLDSDV